MNSGNYLEAEKELAELLGWTNIRESAHYFGSPRLCGEHRQWHNCFIPRWTQDNAEAFKLMCEYEIYPVKDLDEGWVTVTYYKDEYHRINSGDAISNHPDKQTAIRWVIVQAVIMKLKRE